MHAPNWTQEELQDLIDSCSEESIIDRLENRRNKPVYVAIAKAMQAQGHHCDWTQLQCKIKALRSEFYHAKDANSRFGAGCTVAPFYDQLSIILSKDAGDTPGMVTFRTKVEEEKEEESTPTEAAPPETCIMGMSEEYGDCSVLLVDGHCQEEKQVTLQLIPVLASPSTPGSSTDQLEEEGRNGEKPTRR
ncbi:hypothetical protein Y1Q_0020343 [Alligator mississippiensis]|nr:hypothetical protein Y1Q_0020343 [Alligator mississippiensis]